MSNANDRAVRRLEKCLAAVAGFARIGEEILVMRKAAAPGPNRDRLDRMIALNRETLVAIRRSLVISEDDVGRSNLINNIS
jgi:hypothetical protein